MDNIRKLLRWTIGGIVEHEPDYQGEMDYKLSMVFGYLKGWQDWNQCKSGNHRYSSWNGNSSRDGLALRICDVCGVEMPNSRKGEKNYRDYKEYAKSQIEMFEKLVK